MSRLRAIRVFIPCAAVLLFVAMLPQCGSLGFGARDFEKVSENGFDAADNEVDHNDYAWAMRYFQADGAEDGYVYVGTGNNIANLIYYYFTTLASGGEILDAPVTPPEIRRYRPDQGPTTWERVLDYRDVQNEGEYQTTGFRFMGTYEAVVDTKGDLVRANYLYAATQGLESELWRSRTGDAGDWEVVFTTGEYGPSIRYFCTHKGKMYLAMAYDTFEQDPHPGELWVSDDGLNFTPVMQDGFGNANNRGVEFVVSFNGWLYAGTKNDVEGYEIWKLDGPEGGTDFVKVVDKGATDPVNEIAGTPVIFKDHLYVGSIIFFGFNPQQMQGFKGCDIIRLDTDDNWDVVVGPHSTSGYDSGFNYFTNAYCWWMEEHDGWLYAGTWDQGTVLSWILDNIPELIEFVQSAGGDEKAVLQELERLDLLYTGTHAGADIFRTQDGDHWIPVTTTGFDTPGNYGWRTMESTPDGYLYLGSANPVDGLEVWRAKTPED
ncbi:MAG: hypothetical protein IT365_04160 [Candidatus Hydrogenedentes bacterium]|nr:hypothetical protein [Candidatus Hydrogenedentota bacterium]